MAINDKKRTFVAKSIPIPMKKILIVEDELIIAHEIKRALTKLNYQVVDTVDCAEDAIAAVQEVLPDLVLMDINIAGKQDGIATATLLKKQFELPIIFLTAFSDEATIERAKTAEPYGFIVKPFDARDLKTTIEIVLHKHQQDREQQARNARITRVFSHIDKVVVAVDANFMLDFLNATAHDITQIYDNLNTYHLNDTVLFYSLEEHKRMDWTRLLQQATDSLREKMWCYFPETGKEIPLSVQINRIVNNDEQQSTAGWSFILSEDDSNFETQDNIAEKNAEVALSDAEEGNFAKYFFAKKGNKYHKIALNDILWVEALENYVIINTPKDKYTVFSSLKNIEQKLPSDLFFKTHRSYIVNLDKVDGYEEGFVSIQGKPIPVSRSTKDELKQKIHLL